MQPLLVDQLTTSLTCLPSQVAACLASLAALSLARFALPEQRACACMCIPVVTCVCDGDCVCLLPACLQSTYQLKLLARVPIFNPNFLSAYIEGDLHVLFYKTIAGSGKIKPVRLPPRAAPKVGELAAVAALPREGGGGVLCSGQGAGAVHMHGMHGKSTQALGRLLFVGAASVTCAVPVEPS